MEKSTPRRWDLPASFILFLAVLFSAWRLQTADWAEGLAERDLKAPLTDEQQGRIYAAEGERKQALKDLPAQAAAR